MQNAECDKTGVGRNSEFPSVTLQVILYNQSKASNCKEFKEITCITRLLDI